MIEPTIGPVPYRAKLRAAWALLTTRDKQFFYHHDLDGRQVVAAIFIKDAHHGILGWMEEVAQSATRHGFKEGMRFEAAKHQVKSRTQAPPS